MWSYDGGTYESKQEMFEHIRDYEYYLDDFDFERWVDDNYRASQILWRIKDEGSDTTLNLWEEYEQAWYDEAGEPVEGEDFDFNGFEFVWVDDDTDDEDDDSDSENENDDENKE